MRTPDETAGRKGRCPHCSVKVMIPDQSIASSGPLKILPQSPTTSSNAPISPGAKWKTPSQHSASPKPQPSGTIEFTCSHCQSPVKVSASAAGKQGECPQCKAVVKIPLQSVVPATLAGLQPIITSDGLTLLPSSDLKPLGPKGGSTPGLTPLPTPGLTPLPTPGLTPIQTQGLTPLPTPGLTPIPTPGLTPIPSGLTPISNPAPVDAGLTPLGPDLMTPFSSDPLAQSRSDLSNPFGDLGGSAISNPYSSPQSISARRPKPSFDDSKRRGLPWEIPDEENAFFGTMGKLLNTMGDAFSEMKCRGGFFKPLSFLLVSHLFILGVLIMLGLIVLGILALTSRGLPTALKDPTALDVGALLIGLLIFVFEIVFVLGMVATTSFLAAAVMHAILLLFGQANRNYETTYRVYCYSIGASLPLALIPGVGFVAYTIVYFVLNIKGLMKCHHISGGAASAAVLLPLVIVAALAIGLVVMSMMLL
jgi:DNA-directed RNA polymerase subunit RPC12/RpoP